MVIEMNNDRELLEHEGRSDKDLLTLAAKAAGYEWCWHCTPIGKLFQIKVRNIWVLWNPLENDGDALRLAAKLKITIGPDSDEKNALAEAGWGYPMVMEDYLDDPYAATRRTIVRAAAEIGRNMK